MHDAFCSTLGPVNHFVLHHGHELACVVWAVGLCAALWLTRERKGHDPLADLIAVVLRRLR